jgi:hypothetical protein
MFRSFDPEESFTAWSAASQLITRTISNDNYAYAGRKHRPRLHRQRAQPI